MEKTFYDFNKERLPLKILGGFAILTQPTSHYLLNMLLVMSVISLYIYIGLMSILTMATTEDKISMIQAFYTLGSMVVAIGLSSVKIYTRKTVNASADLLRRGVFRYGDGITEEYDTIRKKRVLQIRFFVAFITFGLFSCAFTNTFLVPALRFVLLKDSEALERPVNPFLPLPIVAAFDTRTTIGYLLAFASNALTIFFMYSSFACHEETYLSCAVQLGVEFEILNYSLRNIERRAYVKLKRGNSVSFGNLSMQNLYETVEFQECLYNCLRDNILHHHAILRLKKCLTPYLEATNFVAVLFISILVATAIFIIIENPKSQLTLVTDIFGFLPMCVSGQIVINVSDSTRDSLYDTPWPYCNEKFKALLKVIMSNVQRPVILRARVFNVILCLETFADMFSTGYKITNVLR